MIYHYKVMFDSNDTPYNYNLHLKTYKRMQAIGSHILDHNKTNTIVCIQKKNKDNYRHNPDHDKKAYSTVE